MLSKGYKHNFLRGFFSRSFLHCRRKWVNSQTTLFKIVIKLVDRIAILTINDKYLWLLIAVFNYAERNDFITYNSAKGLKVKLAKSVVSYKSEAGPSG